MSTSDRPPTDIVCTSTDFRLQRSFQNLEWTITWARIILQTSREFLEVSGTFSHCPCVSKLEQAPLTSLHFSPSKKVVMKHRPEPQLDRSFRSTHGCFTGDQNLFSHSCYLCCHVICIYKMISAAQLLPFNKTPAHNGTDYTQDLRQDFCLPIALSSTIIGFSFKKQRKESKSSLR